jgi:Tol biopolymer transport system component
MPIDDRLSNALERAAGSLPRTAGDWDGVRGAAVHRRHQRRTQASVAIAAIAAITLGVILATGNTDDRSIVTAAPTSAQVVATIDGRVVVLSGDDGEAVRTLSEAAPDLDATSVTATPDGETVYVQRGTECDGQAPPSIWRLPASGGPATEIGVGIRPLVSPDGRWLAYAASTDDAPGDCGPFDRLVAVDLQGQSADGSVGAYLDFAPSGYATPIAWSADSASLAIFVNEDPAGRGFVTIAVNDAGLTETGRITEPSANGLAYLPSGEVISAFPTEPTSRISTFDPETGAELDLVAEISEPLYLIDVDPSGTAFLLEGPLADTPNGHHLYRADVGDPDPVKIAGRVTDAVWLSSASRPSAEILAKVIDNGVPKIVVVSATDGRVVREVTSDPALGLWGGVSVTADGRTAYLTIGQPDPPTANCSSDIEQIPVVASVDLSDGEVTPLLLASAGPIASPDGQRLAYHTGAGGCSVLPDERNPALGVMAIASTEATRPYDRQGRRPYAPIAWSQDGERLLADGPSGDNRTTSHFVLDQFPFDPDPTVIEPPQRFVTAAYLPDGRLVVAYVAEDDRRLGNDPLATYHVVVVDQRGRIAERLFRMTARFHIEHIAADPSGRLVLTSSFGGLAIWAPGDRAPLILVAGGGAMEFQGADWLSSEPT